jgi:hypothetical protein
MYRWIKDLKSLWIMDIIKRKKETPFIIFTFFLLSFLLSRLIVYFLPGFNIADYFVGKYHIHHFFYGIALIVVSNWVVFVTDSIPLKRISAGIFGFGLGLIADEIGIFLACGTSGMMCDPDKLYWARINYDAVMYIALILLMIIYFQPMWYHFHTRVSRFFKRK